MSCVYRILCSVEEYLGRFDAPFLCLQGGALCLSLVNGRLATLLFCMYIYGFHFLIIVWEIYIRNEVKSVKGGGLFLALV